MMMTIASMAHQMGPMNEAKPSILQRDISGELVVDNNDPVDLNIREIDTICAINAAT